MAQPPLPVWATDTNFSSGPKSGSPTKIEPSLGAKQQGDVPGQPYRSERKNWLFNLFAEWCRYARDLHLETAFLDKAYDWINNHIFQALVTFESGFEVTGGGDVSFGSSALLRTSAVKSKHFMVDELNTDLTIPSENYWIRLELPDGVEIENFWCRAANCEITLYRDVVATGVNNVQTVIRTHNYGSSIVEDNFVVTPAEVVNSSTRVYRVRVRTAPGVAPGNEADVEWVRILYRYNRVGQEL